MSFTASAALELDDINFASAALKLDDNNFVHESQ